MFSCTEKSCFQFKEIQNKKHIKLHKFTNHSIFRNKNEDSRHNRKVKKSSVRI